VGGEADGAAHPNVALIAFYSPEGRFRCTATLVTPTVLVTAAHCTFDTVGKTVVTFQSVLADQAPSPLPRAVDDAGDGTSAVGFGHGEALPSGYLLGRSHTHPAYSNFTDIKNWNDTGVVVLDRPVTGIPLAALAPAGYLARVAQPVLNKTAFGVVGYGTNVGVESSSGPHKPVPLSYPLERRRTTTVGQKLTSQILQTNGNDKDPRAGGGTCFGDSGGPVFLNGYLVADTSYGLTDNCRYIGGYQRVDIPIVQSWLATFGVTPAAG
jgi:hypothetical protein